MFHVAVCSTATWNMWHKDHNTMSHSSFFAPLHKTRFENLCYTHIAAGLWRFVVTADGMENAVGPHYATRAELLADIVRYAAAYGYDT